MSKLGKRVKALAVLCLCGVAMMTGTEKTELLAYSMPDGNGGLKLAVRNQDSENWKSIGNGWTFLGSDFGAWGSGKKMHNVRIGKDSIGDFWILFNPDQKGEVAAYTHTQDFQNWKPQEYRANTSDWEKHISADVSFSPLIKAKVGNAEVVGSIIMIDSEIVPELEGYIHYRQYLSSKESERMDQDPWRFKNLKPLTATISLDENGAKKISDEFIGIFFEDINYAADGGLYAELIRNRDFEFCSQDHSDWISTTGWELNGDLIMRVLTEDPIHPNNPHYISLSTSKRGGEITNEGFDGISVVKGEKYLFSFYSRSAKKTSIKVSVCSEDGKTIGETKISLPSGTEWRKETTSIIAKESNKHCHIKMEIPSGQIIELDMISLFPENTFRGRRNGLRKDLAETLAALHPKFMRFPGGCVSHGNGIDNIYDWKGSIGPVEARKPLPNLWGYHQTRGLGFHEYFQFCEDLNMEPLPVLAAGVPCQNSSRPSACSHDALTSNGQQGGISIQDMPAYIQDIMDLIEYANGPAESTWGQIRKEAGHPEPFGMKYLGIGNEDLISETFKERFKMIRDAVNEKYPEITVIGTVGPFFEGSDYDEGWRFAKEEGVEIVDEHYYVQPGWFIHNRGFYDNYDRNGPKVYLGEYASHYPGRESNLEAALSIGLYLTDVERNADIVAMTSYAPLFSKNGRTQWRPDLIYFDNDTIVLTPDYYVQQMYGANSGNIYFPSEIKFSDQTDKERISDDIRNRVGVSTVVDEVTGDVILRIANLLPVEINLDLEGYPKGVAEVTTLTGSPRQKDATPILSECLIEGKIKVPDYSFTVIRFKTPTKKE